MPKKHRQYTTSKPRGTVHPSLSHSPYSGHPTRETPHEDTSVNNLIQHLRKTQISRSEARSAATAEDGSRRTIHPAIRSLLELPQREPPRPRQGTVRVGERRVRRTPGPAAPLSWIQPTAGQDGIDDEKIVIGSGQKLDQPIDRLPGIQFPSKGSFQDLVLMKMAKNWDWHLYYDGIYLSELPTNIKELLLSYIVVYTNHDSIKVGMKGLKPLFMNRTDESRPDDSSDVTRLDLCHAIGRWISMKQLRTEMRAEIPASKDDGTELPTSWEDGVDVAQSTAGSIPPQPFDSRFGSLKFLSLANPAPNAGNWVTLLNLLSSLPTLTHLSLAHWPWPSLSSVPPPETKWSQRFITPSQDDPTLSQHVSTSVKAGAPAVLAKLSRCTYCLEWLDLEGCTDWIQALYPEEINDDGRLTLVTPCPDWNGSWRGLKWLGLAPGFIPEPHEDDNKWRTLHGGDLSHAYTNAQHILSAHRDPHPDEATRLGQQLLDSASLNVALEEPRRRYERDQRELWQSVRYRDAAVKARTMAKSIQKLRTEAKGKWIEMDIGPSPGLYNRSSHSTIRVDDW